MTKKRSFFFMFCLFLFIFMICFQPCILNSNYSLKNNANNSILLVKSSLQTLRSYQGKDHSWVVSGTYDEISWGNNFYYVGIIGSTSNFNFTHNFTPISTRLVPKVHLTGSIIRDGISSSSITEILIIYQDTSEEIIYQTNNTGTTNYDLDISLTSDKIIKGMKFFGSTPTSAGHLRISISFENYIGYMPEVSNISYQTNIKEGELGTFSCDLEHINESFAENITFIYAETGNYVIHNLSSDWTSDSKYYKDLTFSTTGTYYFTISIQHDWNFTNSALYTFYVGDYPKESYLSLFSNLDGFPLESKDFKVYLGQDEEINLVNFRDYFGNWSQIYAGIVNASYVDNFIRFNCTTNGLKTTFEDLTSYPTSLYNSLLFEAKVSNNTRVVVIYNPTYHEKDYYIDFTENMSGFWYSIEIPFFAFNQYNNMSSGWLSELGFWISNNSIQISNIRIAMHYNKTFIQQAQIQLNMTSSNATCEKITNGYNNSQANWENVTIADNASISSNITGHYRGSPNSTDFPGSFPVLWTNSYAMGTFIAETSEIVGSLKNVFWLNDSTGGNYPVECYNVSNHVNGSFEFYLRASQTNQNIYFALMRDSNDLSTAGMSKCYKMNTGGVFQQRVSTSWYNLDSPTAYSANTFYFIQIVYNLTKNEFLIYIDHVLVSNDTYSYSQGHINQFMLRCGDNTDSECYLDALNPDAFNYSIYHEDSNSFYYSKIIDFNQSVDILNVSIEKTQFENTSLSVFISDNLTSDFNNYVSYSYYNQSDVRFLKFKLLLNNTCTKFLQYLDNITFFHADFYSGCYNYSLLGNDFDNLYFYVLNNNSLSASANLINDTSQFNTSNLQNSTNWENIAFSVNSSMIYLQFNYSSFENESIYMREIFETKNETYRLISIENRQNPNAMSFDFETESIAILDYFNNVLYRMSLNYTSYIDIALPITTMTFYNYYSHFIYVTLTRGLGVEVEIAIAPESSVSLRVFATSYLLHIRNYELETLLLEDFSPDSSDQITFKIGERQSVDYDPFDDSTVRILIIIVICLAIALIAIYAIQARDLIKKLNETKKSVRKIEKSQSKDGEKREIKKEIEDVRRKIRKTRL